MISSPIHAERQIHQVRSGETLWSIARSYQVPIQEIARANQMPNPKRLEVGQKLVIPTSIQEKKEWLGKNNLRELTLVSRGKLSNWKYIVIHHSATPNGDAHSFDQFHRNERHMKNGLAYHFVIGNGKGAEDGEIEVGGRWAKQLSGGHCSNHKMNKVGIGICLVGNFEKTRPTRKQLKALVDLVKYIQKLCHIPNSRVILHKEVRQKSTLCPGKKFPVKRFQRML